MNIKKSIVLRARLAFFFIFLFSVAIMVRLISVQTIQGAKWRKIARENLLQYKEVKATRGNIYSDNGSLLATSLPFYKLAFDPQIADNTVYEKGIDSLAYLLAHHFKDKSKMVYKRRINDARKKDRRYLVLNSKYINYSEKKEMECWPIFREGRLGGGVIFEKADKRFKPFSSLAYRTIGFINEDNHGAGLEYSFNNFLEGKDGEALFQKIAGGAWKPMDGSAEITPQEGLDIQTTLDVNIQDVAEESLERHLKKYKANYGCVVFMEVATGAIKALVNLSRVGEDKYAATYNYAVGSQGLMEPGSTFKLASMMALFEDSNVLPADSVETGDGAFKYYDKVMTDSKSTGFGTITVQEAFEKSSNIGVSKLISTQFGLHPEKFINYLAQFGLTQPLNFQMAGEGIPYIKTPKDKTWSGVSLPWMSIGYELKLTPLQILTFYNGVANNGKMVKPMIVKEVRKADQVKETFGTEVIREKLCSDKTLGYLKGMLEGVVERGTARNISDADYKIAGKTGTAQKLVNGSYTKQYRASFAGYFPADHPKYSCIVVIDDPKGLDRYGSEVAAPIFKEIADKVYATDLDLHAPLVVNNTTAKPGIFPVIQSGMEEDLKLICNELGISNHTDTAANATNKWVTARAVNNSIEWVNRKVVAGLVPDVRGMTLRDAMYILENTGLKVEYSGIGRVVTQSLPIGRTINKGETIFVVLN